MEGATRAEPADPMPAVRAGARTLGLLCAVAWVSCAGAEQVRQLTYPQSFQYLSQEELRSSMGLLAAQVRALQGLMAQEGGLRPQDQDQVIAILSHMRSLAGQLKKREDTNHPRIDRFAPRLQQNLDRALFGARRDPPNYAFTGTVAGSCEYCHAAREISPPPPRLDR